ncbi:NACHT domain-containing protein [Gigaspora margarita]|uniref:NACHT domain-containing protein n=1 Tax=Gigaspora margarita TaxID=4874 RepID=A0A8H4EMM3_GIGMA|nr:NACHT domain-containing protein [Gigaspora margarita]
MVPPMTNMESGQTFIWMDKHELSLVIMTAISYKIILLISENIIEFHGVTKDNSGLIQYANGETLHDYLKAKFKELRWIDKLNIAIGIARELSFLHSKDIIHRDLHSKNILIHEVNPKIADFGTSKQINGPSMNSNSNFIGVLEYTDPQCIMHGEEKRKKESDVYSFGIVLWEISSGTPPYQDIRSTKLENSKLETYISFNICVKKKREEPIEGTPAQYIELYKKCWDDDPAKRPETNEILNTLEQIIRDEMQIEEGLENLKEAQLIDLDTNLGQIGKLENQYLEDLNGFKEIPELYIKPRGTWNVPIIKTLDSKEEIDYEEKGDIENVVDGFLTSKDKLTSHDKEKLKEAITKFIDTGKKTLLIETVNGFFKLENQLTLEDINVLNAATDQFLALKDKNALKLLKIAINQFLTSNESNLENSILNVFEDPLALENELFKEIKLALNHQITIEEMEVIKNALNNKKVLEKKELEKTANKLLALKTKEFLENEINKLLTLKHKRVLLILGSEGTGKSTFNRYLARRLRENAKKDMTQPIPLFIALAPLEEFINKNRDFIETYLQEIVQLSPDIINELRNRRFVFILDGYDEIAKRECHFYNSIMFYKWKNAKFIISSRPEYLDKGYEKKFWPKENGKRGFQELTLASFLWAEIKPCIKNYFNKYVSPLSWNADTYIQQIEQISQIKELVCNSIILKIILTVLPDLRERDVSKTYRIYLYDEFIKKWFKRSQDRLQEFNCLDKFTDFCKKFALEMFLDKNKVVVDYNPVTDTKLNGMPLIRRKNQCWFFHKSLRDYLISCALLDSLLKDTHPETLLNKYLITSEPAIQQFLAEQIENMPEQKKLMTDFIERSKVKGADFIERSKEDEAYILTASANAITVLSRSPLKICQIDLNDICVPRADLRNRDFSNLDLTRANLNDVNFQDAKLQGAKLEGASLQNAKLQCANLEDAFLQDANLSGSNLSGANLQNSNIQGANFHKTYLRDVKFKGASLRVQDFQELDFPHTGSEKSP